jgi:hypothetical protein
MTEFVLRKSPCGRLTCSLLVTSGSFLFDKLTDENSIRLEGNFLALGG